VQRFTNTVIPVIQLSFAASQVDNFNEVIHPGPKVTMANTLNCKQIFELSLLKIVGAPVPGEGVGLPQMFLGQAPIFKTWIIKLNTLSIIWQSFAAIGLQS